jgi:hypothetical protein
MEKKKQNWPRNGILEKLNCWTPKDAVNPAMKIAEKLEVPSKTASPSVKVNFVNAQSNTERKMDLS